MSEITLTSSMRNNLVNLQQTTELLSQTQQRLATGKRVNSALDNPTNFFSASAHMQRANDLANRKDGMTESIQAIKATDSGITGLKTLLESAKGIIETARSTTASGLSALYTQFNEVTKQIGQLINDSDYKGTNFLNGTTVTLDVLFNETGSNKLTMTGFDALVSGLLNSGVTQDTGSTVGYSNLAATISNISTFVAGSAAIDSAVTGYSAVAGFSNAETLNAIAAGLTAAISQLQVQSAKMASNLAIVNARLDFTNSLINVEKTGADKLTLADTNEEGANMLMLQTRSQLGTTSLSLASQAAQGVLRLF